MILESIVTTLNSDRSLNVSPMGPSVSQDLKTFVLRPFDTSTTFANLKRDRAGVMHVTDDVLLFARAAIGDDVFTVPGACSCDHSSVQDAQKIDGKVLTGACRYYEFEVDYIDQTGPRMTLNCRTLKSGRLRDFWGFNRAKHAVIEAAILATRLDFLPSQEIAALMKRLQTIVDKTAGEQETQAMMLLAKFIQSHAREQ
jgi:hypothetical protein